MLSEGTPQREELPPFSVSCNLKKKKREIPEGAVVVGSVQPCAMLVIKDCDPPGGAVPSATTCAHQQLSVQPNS